MTSICSRLTKPLLPYQLPWIVNWISPPTKWTSSAARFPWVIRLGHQVYISIYISTFGVVFSRRYISVCRHSCFGHAAECAAHQGPDTRCRLTLRRWRHGCCNGRWTGLEVTRTNSHRYEQYTQRFIPHRMYNKTTMELVKIQFNTRHPMRHPSGILTYYMFKCHCCIVGAKRNPMEIVNDTNIEMLFKSVDIMRWEFGYMCQRDRSQSDWSNEIICSIFLAH